MKRREPIITVLMPVYNGAAYLKTAIESVLSQSFADFEFLIINDGSSDDSGQIIDGYSDDRIRHITNQQNNGLIQTLNTGISLARARYIARMDADDICLPQRLQLQKDFLERYADISFVATTIRLIDENGNAAGLWALDQQTISPEQIRKVLPNKNCIAHPSVMGRTAAFRKYGYHAAQLHTEDYDLWLRVINDGDTIGKIAAPQLLYRQHSGSVTSAKLKSSFALKHFHLKRRFLAEEIKKGNVNLFTAKVFGNMLLDGATALVKNIKRNVHS